MQREIIATGKDIEDAKETAHLLLNASENDVVEYEVLDAGSKGILGILKVRPAKVRAYIKSAEVEEPKKEIKKDRSQSQPKAAPKEKPKKKPKEPKEPIEIVDFPEEKVEPVEPLIPEAELKMEKKEVAPGEHKPFDFVTSIIKNAELDAEATLYDCEDGSERIVISGPDASLLIGHHGDTLTSLQYLTSLTNTKKSDKNHKRVTIDIEGYRAKREETLRALARRMGEKALKNNRSVMLEPMSPYERRIIHAEIQTMEGVSTNSVGSGTNRKVVIYVLKKNQKKTADPENNA